MLQVEMAEKLDEPFCFDADVDKSFQLVFPARTVDLVAKDAEEAALLARGFQVRAAKIKAGGVAHESDRYGRENFMLCGEMNVWCEVDGPKIGERRGLLYVLGR